MKALAMQIWEMPANDFAIYLLGMAIVVVVARHIQAEIHISRMKRMTRQGLR